MTAIQSRNSSHQIEDLAVISEMKNHNLAVISLAYLTVILPDSLAHP